MLRELINTAEQRTLLLAQIRRDGGTQPREGIDWDHVKDMQQALADGAALPAISVIYDGADYWLWDGFHRWHAYANTGKLEIPVVISQGTQDDAQWESFAANQAHGLKRTPSEKERAIRGALKHPKSAGMSNMAIAKHLGVSDKTVAQYREKMELSSEIPKITTRTVERNGQTYQQNTANIGANRPQPPGMFAVWELETTVRSIYSQVYGGNPEPYATRDMRTGAQMRAGRFWLLCTQSLPANQFRLSDLAQAINNFAAQIEAQRNGTNAQPNPVRPAVAPRTAPPADYTVPEAVEDKPLPDWAAGEDLTWDLPSDLRADGWTLHVEPAGEMIASHPQHGELLDRHFDGNVADMRARMKELSSGSALIGPGNYLTNDEDVGIYNALLRAAATYIKEWNLKDTPAERVRVLKGQYNLLLVEVRKLIEDPGLPEFRFIRIWNGAIQMERYKDPSDLAPTPSTPDDALEETLRTHFNAPLPTASHDPWLTAATAPVRRQERAALLADALQPWIAEYTDEYGRDWKHLAEYGNPSHSNSTFWQNIQEECQRRNVRIDDDTLKSAIKQAFATMLAQHQAEAPATIAQTVADVVEVYGGVPAAEPVEATEAVPVSQRADYESDEWYTPAEYIDAAKAVMGAIDLDPASSEMAQTVVRAGVYLTRFDDGLSQTRWIHQRIWLNPPYSNPGPWIEKLVREHQAGPFCTEAIVLVNNATETSWFQLLLERFPVCLPARRLAFWRHDHANVGARQGQAFFYLGPNDDRFEEVFRQFGPILRRVA